MHAQLRSVCLFLLMVGVLSFSANAASAQEDSTPKKRLGSKAVARGFVGGEAHDSYVVYARRGRTVTVRISWRPEGDNRAEFTVSDSSNFFGAQQVQFGKASADGKRWVGRIPKTGNYYIYVVAHPSARYTLDVRVR